MLENLAFSGFQKARWECTIKANVSLQSDKENVYDVAKNKISLLNGASLSSRLIIEMAICECPLESGKEAGVLDIQELMCFASLMHHMGGLSEEIHFDATKPKLTISAFGDVLYNHDFHDKILESYKVEINKIQLGSSIDDYAKNFIKSEPVEVIDHILDDKFLNAWVDEFGFTIDDIRAFIDSIEDEGFKRNELIYQLSYQELLELFDSDKVEIAKTIIRALVTYPRNSWKEIPEPFKASDWQPWRFRRRFSFIMRPIIRVDNENFIISPQHIRDSFGHLFRICYETLLDENNFSSKLMKSFVGHNRAKSGLAFNTKVFEWLKKNGWEVREEIKLTEVLNQKLSKDFGDIDVLAWNKEKRIVAVIECKDLEFAKTHGEIARQIYEFKGVINEKGKQDRLLKHIARLDELNSKTKNLSKFTQIPESEISIKGYVVFSNLVPMLFNENRLHRDKVEFLTFEQLDSLSN